MAFDFPTAPTIGQKYPVTPVTGMPTYTWDGEKWTTVGLRIGVSSYFADTAPINPPDGALWWETDTGNLYIRYNDGDSSQWVPAMAVPIAPVPATALPLMDGAAAVGVASKYAREDHLNQTDTSRYAATKPAGYHTAPQLAAIVPAASSAAPAMDGAAAAGAAATFSRGDHVHPTDTSRAPVSNPTFIGTVTTPTLQATTGAIGSLTTNSQHVGGGNTLVTANSILAVDNNGGLAMQVMSSLNAATTAMVIRNDRTDGAAIQFFFGTSSIGSIANNGTNIIYGTSSDYRLKTTYGPAADLVGAMIDTVPVYEAEFNTQPGERWPMFLAHELQAACPWAVFGEKDGTREMGALSSLDAEGRSVVLGTEVARPDTLAPGQTWTKSKTVEVMQQVDASHLVALLWAELQNVRARLAALEGAA